MKPRNKAMQAAEADLQVMMAPHQFPLQFLYFAGAAALLFVGAALQYLR